MEKKYNFVYKTTHKESGKYYIGVHSTDNIDDGYLGSGTRIKSSIKKYGKDSFERDVLRYFDNKKDAYLYEKKLVTLDLIGSDLCMNMTEGGYGGAMSGDKNPMFGKKHSDDVKSYISKINKGRKRSKETRAKISKRNYNSIWINNGYEERFVEKDFEFKEPWVRGRVFRKKPKLSESHKNKIRKSRVGIVLSDAHKKKIGKFSSSRMWITNGTETRYVSKDSEIPDGWKRGRHSRKNN
jgi:hypothetical protein